jgi:hypothetical protein
VLGRSSDGYELARALDDLGYSLDAELVEILDEIGFLRLNICSRLEEQWVKVSGLTGPAVGSKVQFKNVNDRKDYEGKSLKIRLQAKASFFASPSATLARAGEPTGCTSTGRTSRKPLTRSAKQKHANVYQQN